MNMQGVKTKLRCRRFMGEFPEKDWTVFRRQALGRPDTTARRDLGLFLR